MYLAAAGVGRIGLRRLRRGRLQSNLQRQMHPRQRPTSAGGSSTRPRSTRLNARSTRTCELETHELVTARLEPTRSTCLGGYDVIVDGTDNFPTRYLVNDACVLLGKPNAYGSDLPLRGPGMSVFCRARTDRATAASIAEPPPPGLVPSMRRRAACWASCRG